MNRVFFGHCIDSMRQLAADGVRAQTCVTSPPYWGLRDYGVPPSYWPAMEYAPMPGLPPVSIPELEGCLGLEPDPLMFVGHIVQVFRAVRDVLADDGTCWVNFGDSYAQQGTGTQGETGQRATRRHTQQTICRRPSGIKPKDLVGIPWRVAYALQADGWYLRQDIIWHKPNPMPESVTDRCTKAHEYFFLLTKSERYFYDAEAIKEQAHYLGPDNGVGFGYGYDKDFKGRKVRSGNKERKPRPGIVGDSRHQQGSVPWEGAARNKRSVWVVTTKPYSGAHFATFPPELIEPCILAGSRPGDIVLDPFFGSGTTGEVAERLGRQWIGCEIGEQYAPLQRERTRQMGMAI